MDTVFADNKEIPANMAGCSVNATEHSITTTAIAVLEKERSISKLEAEVSYIREVLFKAAPTGILSHVSDSFDFWKFVSEGLPMLKEDILSREGKFVIRPDSGDPVKILTGYTEDEVVSVYRLDGEYDVYCDTTGKLLSQYEVKGLIECLGDLFGTTPSPTGLKLLHDNIGAIYGDSITLERQDQIISRLEDKGYAGLVVLG